MTRRTVELTAVGAFAVVEAVVAVLVIVDSHHEAHKALAAALDVTAGLSFVITGLIALHLRPRNRTGLYLSAIGYLWFLLALTDANDDVVYTAGIIASNLAFIPFAALILSFPTGLLDRAGRRIVELTAWFVLIGPPLVLLFDRTPMNDCSAHGSCPHSAIVVDNLPGLANAIGAISTVITVGLVVAVVVLLTRNWRAATEPARRVLLPVYVAGTGALVALVLGNVVSAIAPRADIVIDPLFLALFAMVPLAFLYGLLRSRLARGSVAGLMVALGHGAPVRSALADALGDPSLRLAFWLERDSRYVDSEGRPLDLSQVPRRGISAVERDGHRVGALLHDESLADEPELIESVGAAAAFALDNARLEAELRAQNEFLTTVFRTAPSLLVTIDTEARIRSLNPATLAASGYDNASAVRGRFFWDVFLDPGDRHAMKERFAAAAPDHPPAEYENTFTNAGGDRISVIWRGAPVAGPSGAVESIVAAGLDATERRRQEAEIRASRGRIVAAGDEERRRLERNLHDGAQQRLVSLSLSLRLAQSKLQSDPAAVAGILTGASEELTLALEELRELARGIHPAVLSDRGLDAALEGLASRAPLPVELTKLGRRLPEPVEAAAYYVVSEAVANVVKHARAGSVGVRVEAGNGSVRIEVADDGSGGADPACGSGLRGLADRVEALDGRLQVESPSGGGTRVVAEIPLPQAGVN